jgi:hypothetical protein
MILQRSKAEPIGGVLTALTGVLILTAACAGWASDAKKREDGQPAKVRTLFGITWQPSRSEALKKATPVSAMETAQPVFLVQMLGDLAGHT